MKYFVSILIVIFSVVLETSFFSNLKSLLIVTPNIILVVLFSWVLIGKHKNAYVGALVGGLLIDIYSGVMFGTTALALLLVTFLAAVILKKFISIENIFSRIISIFLVTIIFKIIFLVFVVIFSFIRIFPFSVNFSGSFFANWFIEASLSSLLITMIFPFIVTLNKFIVRYEAKQGI